MPILLRISEIRITETHEAFIPATSTTERICIVIRTRYLLAASATALTTLCISVVPANAHNNDNSTHVSGSSQHLPYWANQHGHWSHGRAVSEADYSTIQRSGTSLCMTSSVKEQYPVYLTQCDDSNDFQKWSVNNTGYDGWQWVNKRSGLCIEADQGYFPDVETKPCTPPNSGEYPQSQFFKSPDSPEATSFRSAMYDSYLVQDSQFSERVTLNVTPESWTINNPPTAQFHRS